MQNRTILIVTCLFLMGFAALAVAQSDRVGGGRRGTLSLDRNEAVFPAVEIIHYPDRSTSIGLLDTRTGAIYRFRGSVSNASARSTWEQRVPAVRGATSGKLEIQQVQTTNSVKRDAGRGTRVTFLVDVISGRTWILRLRDNENGTWDEVPIFK